MPEQEPSIHDLLDDAVLNELIFFELTARQPVATPEVGSDSTEIDVSPAYELSFSTSEQKKAFRVRLRTTLELGDGEVIVDGAIEYVLKESETSDYSQDVLLEFAQDVGLMALLPFVRQAIADLTQRVFGTALLMPVVRRGQFQFTLTATN